uniref:Putative bovine pancreatic trypsin inhibitor n=1 Tax=Rhipicephalus microplus TaxID=6941 RepID=A0A6G5A912_RHIMP
MVNAHASFVAVLMTVVPIYGTAPSGTTSLQTRLHKRECSEPLMEEVRFCGNLRIWRYFYNHTSQQCHQFYWDNCLADGVHMTRIDCAKKCNLKEQPGICAEHPAGTCATYQPTSSYYPKKVTSTT